MDNLLDLTSRVEATHFWFRGFRRFIAPAIAEMAGTRRDLQLLDCGCGTGHNLATLLRPAPKRESRRQHLLQDHQ